MKFWMFSFSPPPLVSYVLPAQNLIFYSSKKVFLPSTPVDNVSCTTKVSDVFLHKAKNKAWDSFVSGKYSQGVYPCNWSIELTFRFKKTNQPETQANSRCSSCVGVLKIMLLAGQLSSTTKHETCISETSQAFLRFGAFNWNLIVNMFSSG